MGSLDPSVRFNEVRAVTMQYVKETGSHRQLYKVSDTCAYSAIKIKLTHISLMRNAKMHLQGGSTGNDLISWCLHF